MDLWLSPAEIAARALPETPATKSGVVSLADREGWQTRRNLAGDLLTRRRAQSGGGWEYHYTLLPPAAQVALVASRTIEPESAPLDGSAAWARFESLPDDRKQQARDRLAAIEDVKALQKGGLKTDPAVRAVAASRGVAANSIYNWLRHVAGVARPDWLPYLISHHCGRTKTAGCAPEAWDLLKSDWLRAERPSFDSCYRRLKAAAAQHGWQIPTARTLKRRLDREVPRAVQVLARFGRDALKTLYPAQSRDRTVFHALEAVNADGHKWDVFVRWPDGHIGRPCMTAIQDLYSGKFLSWRVDKTENKEAFRLAVGDMVETYGIPSKIYLDNGRNFASKWMTGGTETRFRFKVRDEDPTGILVTLGVDVHWTTPYSGQSKPIERGFRDFCDQIAKHPRLAGAWTGNTPVNKPENHGSKAIALDVFLAVVEDGIAEHNARAGRRAPHLKGRSFDQAFAESYAAAAITRATEEQRRLWLLAAEGLRARRPDGALYLEQNRYWGDFCPDLVGHPVIARFDPQALHDGLHIYRLDGAYVGFAACQEAAGFADVNAARTHSAARKRWLKAQRDQLDALRTLDPESVADLVPVTTPAPAPERKIVAPVFGRPVLDNLPTRATPAPLDEDDRAAAEALFARLTDDQQDQAANVLTFAPKAEGSAPITPTRPHFDDDAAFARWVLANPDAASAEDQARVAELMTSKSFRLLIGAEAAATA